MSSVTEKFKKEVTQVPKSKLYLITMLRQPIARVLSEFFFVRPACFESVTTGLSTLHGWLRMYSNETVKHICDGNFEGFLRDSGNSANNRQLVRTLLAVISM